MTEPIRTVIRDPTGASCTRTSIHRDERVDRRVPMRSSQPKARRATFILRKLLDRARARRVPLPPVPQHPLHQHSAAGCRRPLLPRSFASVSGSRCAWDVGRSACGPRTIMRMVFRRIGLRTRSDESASDVKSAVGGIDRANPRTAPVMTYTFHLERHHENIQCCTQLEDVRAAVNAIDRDMSSFSANARSTRWPAALQD